MFIDTYICLLSDDTIAQSKQLESLGIGDAKISASDFEFQDLRIRINDVKFIYKSLTQGLCIIELYDTDGNFMVKDDIRRIKKLMDDFYEQKQSL